VKRYLSGRWFTFVCVDNITPQKTSNKEKVGIDLGTINFAYNSDDK